MKRVKQYSIDILIEDTVDGTNLADEIAEILEEKQLVVLGAVFQEDMTKIYKEMFPSLMAEDDDEDDWLVAMDDYFEAVEVCPHCDSENIYPMWDAEEKGYVAVCKTCGKEIFLCDECRHAEDNPNMNCDWCKTDCGGKCFRGITKD